MRGHISFDKVMHKNMRGGRPSSCYFVQSTVKDRVHDFFTLAGWQYCPNTVKNLYSYRKVAVQIKQGRVW